MRIEIKTTLPNTPTAELKGLITRGVKAVELDANGRLLFTLTDNSIADMGGIPMLTAQSISYQAGTSGTEAPTGDWSESVPEAAQGAYLWTRTVLSFNDGTAVTAYSVSRMGLDGRGSVITVNDKSPDERGNVSLSAADVGAAETEHGHEISGVTGLSDVLNGKAAASHNHEISGVTGLSDALSEKAAASHSHTPASIGALGYGAAQTLTAEQKAQALENIGGAAVIHANTHAIGGADPLTPDAIGAMTWTKIWENADPTSSFVQQSITAGYSGFDMVLIVPIFALSNGRFCPMTIIPAISGTKGYLLAGTASRGCELTDTGVSFNRGSSAGGTFDDSYMIPAYIYGIKGAQ